MLQLQDVHFSFEERPLLSGINWAIQPGKRVALIGPNGAGKTTLLRIMTGDLQPQRGEIVKSRRYRIALLPQEEIAVSGDSALRAVQEGRPELIALEARMQELHETLDKTRADQEELLSQLGAAEQEFSAGGGYQWEARARTVLSGLGFSDSDMNRPLNELSGGWRMRVFLGRLLVGDPDLLLLDEPTNHLDLPALEWLEQYLLEFAGSIVIVSHDRYFIDRLAQEITALDRGGLDHYPGNYHFYERKRADKEALQRKKWQEQQEEIRRQKRFIERFRYKATKAAQVQSRIKMLEKMERLEPPAGRPQLGFRLDAGERSYKDVLEIENLSFRYGEEWVFRGADLHVLRGERIALVGPNGAGKTTFARLVSGELKPQEGSLRLGKRTSIGCYAQHRVDSLDLEASIYDEVASTAAEGYSHRIRDALGIFQFSGDDVFKTIGILSGGEKARVSLAKILLSPINFLIMDEPTNHLDLVSREALEEALSQYAGTLLLISHDRYFLDKLVTRVLEVENKALLSYAGNYSYYLEKRALPPLADASAEPQDTSPPAGKKTKLQKRLEAEARQRISKERNRLEGRIAELEEEIDSRESRKREIQDLLCSPVTLQDGNLVASLQKELAALNKGLERNYTAWEKDRLELEDLLRQLPGKSE